MRQSHCASKSSILFFANALIALPISVHALARKPLPVWIDTDISIGLKDRDVDDGLALIGAFHSPELSIRGVSAVFGNTSLDNSFPIARKIVSRFGPPKLAVYSGAASASDIGRETDASRALAQALQKERLTILALGPVTNIATVIKNHPELAKRIVEIVAVAGRRPGQRFTTGTTNRKAHPDFNFEQDPESFRILLASPAPLTLTPFEISSKVWITSRDLDTLANGSPSARYLAQKSRSWLKLWRKVFNVQGFNPFDSLAVGYLVVPNKIHCQRRWADIRVLSDDETEARMQGVKVKEKPYLIASDSSSQGRRVRYCYQPSPMFKKELLRRLSSGK